MAAAVSSTASRTASEQNSRPSTESERSQDSSNRRLGSMPTQSGPRARIRTCSLVPKGSAMDGPHDLFNGCYLVTQHPLPQTFLNYPRGTGIGEARRPHLHGIGARSEEH